MNTYTQGVWEIIGDALFENETLLADLKKILLKDYRLFLSSEEQISQVYCHTLQEYFLEKLHEWYEWLPNTPIHLIGGELALEAFKAVEWHRIAKELRQHLEREK